MATVNTLARVRLRCALLLVMVLTAACGSSSAANSTPGGGGASSAPGPARPPECGPRDVPTLARDRVARVYVTRGVLYGCASGSTRRYQLGNAAACIRTARAGPVALAGTVVAYGLESCGVDTGSAVVVVRRLSTGLRLRSLPATTGTLGPESYQRVSSLVVRPDASVAWIGTASSIIRHTQTIEVHRADTRGLAELDAGAGIGPSSMRLHGRQVSWHHDGAVRSAPLL